jgi:hypothetical protein
MVIYTLLDEAAFPLSCRFGVVRRLSTHYIPPAMYSQRAKPAEALARRIHWSASVAGAVAHRGDRFTSQTAESTCGRESISDGESISAQLGRGHGGRPDIVGRRLSPARANGCVISDRSGSGTVTSADTIRREINDTYAAVRDRYERLQKRDGEGFVKVSAVSLERSHCRMRPAYIECSDPHIPNQRGSRVKRDSADVLLGRIRQQRPRGYSV